MNLSTNFWGGAAAPYEIEQSLRFDGSSSYLSRTFGNDGSSRTWTYSGWIKKASFNDRSQPVLAVGNSSGAQNSFFGVPGTWNIQNSKIPGGGVGGSTVWEGLRRDYSAWYHWVLQKRSSTANDFRLYINGVQLATTNNSTTWNNFNRNITHYIGRDNYDPAFLGGYLAELHFVDNQILDHEDFGEFDANGVWRPIEYTGTYGTNGFYLKFDPSATNGIGHDHSGNGNNFTASGFTTSGTGTDVFSDTPTNNWCTWNPLDSKRDDGSYNYPSNGNLFTRVNSAGNYSAYATNIGFLTSGKWYFEYVPVRGGNNNNTNPGHKLITKDFVDSSSNPTGVNMNCGTQDGDGGTYMVAIDMDNGYVYRGRNGTWSNSGDPTSGSSGTGSVASFTVGTPYRLAIYHRFDTGSSEATHNFGQRAFSYTPPTGYSTLNTANLTAPDIADGSDYFQTVLDTGANIRSTAEAVFDDRLLIVRDRVNTANALILDTVRGGNAVVRLPNKDYEITYSAPSGNSAAWTWKLSGTTSSPSGGSISSTVDALPAAGISVVSYQGTGTNNETVAHGLSNVPEFIMFKNRSRYVDWTAYAAPLGATKYLTPNQNYAGTSSSGPFNNTAPTSSLITLGTSTALNRLNDNHIAFCFASVEGYCKIGSYSGGDGVFVYCGFRPAFIWVKDMDATYNWVVHDTEREPYNPSENIFHWNYTGAMSDQGSGSVDILSNGFITRGGNLSGSGNDTFFIAWAENPFGGSGVSPVTAR